MPQRQRRETREMLRGLIGAALMRSPQWGCLGLLLVLGMAVLLFRMIGIVLGILLILGGFVIEVTSRQGNAPKEVKRQDAWLAVAVAGAGFLILGLTLVSRSTAAEATTPASEQVVAQEASKQAYVAGKGHVGCRSQDDMKTLIRLASQGNREAYVRAATAAIGTGACQRLPADQPIEREDFTWDGLVKVRPNGDVESWWTYLEATVSR